MTTRRFLGCALALNLIGVPAQTQGATMTIGFATADCRPFGLPLTTAYWLLPADLKVVGPDVRTDSVKRYLLKALDRSQTLGVKFVVWGSGDARRAPDGFSREQAFDQLVALGKFLAPEARQRDMILLVLDLYHMTEEGEDASLIVKAGPHIAHMHMSNPIGRVFPLSASEFNYGPFFRALKQIGYHGTMTIETAAVDVLNDGPRTIRFIRSAYAAAAP